MHVCITIAWLTAGGYIRVAKVVIHREDTRNLRLKEPRCGSVGVDKLRDY
ncbi:MAG: hypothetical protein NVS4B11_17880 [Ktedonobacteraceae bacterium]